MARSTLSACQRTPLLSHLLSVNCFFVYKTDVRRNLGFDESPPSAAESYTTSSVNSSGSAHVEVKAVEDYKFLNSSYVPVLRQLESANLQRFYFENRAENETKDATNLKFRNPKYLSMLNHLRFYLPEMYPKLHRILFLDDDVVVQKDLTGLWKINMDGKVNGAVETCSGSFHRYAQYMNYYVGEFEN